MELREDYLKWLDWSWEDKDAFKKAECIDIRSDTENVNPRTEHVLEVPLQIPYTLMVRTYSEAFRKGEEIPDYGQLTVGGRGGGGCDTWQQFRRGLPQSHCQDCEEISTPAKLGGSAKEAGAILRYLDRREKGEKIYAPRK